MKTIVLTLALKVNDNVNKEDIRIIDMALDGFTVSIDWKYQNSNNDNFLLSYAYIEKTEEV